MNEIVTILKDEYVRLKALEKDLGDLQSVSKILQRLDAGEEELLPPEVVDRLLDGAAPLLFWREHRNLTQSELARRSKVNRIQTVDIETGRKTGSVTTLSKLAAALNVNIDDLVSPSIPNDESGAASHGYDATPGLGIDRQIDRPKALHIREYTQSALAASAHNAVDNLD